MKPITLLGAFCATVEADRTLCTLLPDPGQLPGGFECEKVILFPTINFAAMMKELQIERRYGTSILLEGPCLVQGLLCKRPQEVACVLDNTTFIEIVTTTFSYVPNRVFSVSYLINLTDSALQSQDVIHLTSNFDPTAFPIKTRVRIRGYLVTDPFSDLCWLSPAEEGATDSPNQNTIRLPNSLAVIVKNYLPQRIDRFCRNDSRPYFSGWVTVEGTLLSEPTSLALRFDEIVVISIFSGRLCTRIWWDPTRFKWHNQL